MTRYIVLVFILLVIVSTASVKAADEKEISRNEFWDLMRRSMEATNDNSFRARVTIQHSDLPDGGWTLYSSWVCDYVFPDRSHLLYTHRLHREIVSIGKTTYTREPDQPWVRSEQEKPKIVSTAAGIFGYLPTARFLLIESESLNGVKSTLIRVTSKSGRVKDKSKEAKIANYWLDEEWALIGKESIVFNESCACGSPKWQRQFETYEYSQDIRVEAPTN